MHRRKVTVRLALIAILFLLEACQQSRPPLTDSDSDSDSSSGSGLLGGFSGNGADFSGGGSSGGAGTETGTGTGSGAGSGTGTGASGSSLGPWGLPFNTRISGGAIPYGRPPSLQTIDELFEFLGLVPPAPFVYEAPALLICYNVDVPRGGRGDDSCRVFGSTCTRVTGSTGNQFFCSTTTTPSEPANTSWTARCCQDLSSIHSVAPTGGLECVETQVSPGKNGNYMCELENSACFGVVGSSGKQSAYCATTIRDGTGTQNPFWLARCCRNRRPTAMIAPTCRDMQVPLTSSGDEVCAGDDKRCVATLASHGYQSLLCSARASTGNNSRRPTWAARCCK